MTPRPALPDAQVRLLRASLLGSPHEFRKEWLDADGRVVVPFEPPLTVPEDFAERLCRALGQEGAQEAWGFSSESWPGILPHEGVVVPIDPDSVRRWHSEFLPFDMVLTIPGYSRAVLFGQDEFGLAAGPRQFVETALGMPVSDALTTFTAYADDMATAARHLPGVAARYVAGGVDLGN